MASVQCLGCILKKRGWLVYFPSISPSPVLLLRTLTWGWASWILRNKGNTSSQVRNKTEAAQLLGHEHQHYFSPGLPCHVVFQEKKCLLCYPEPLHRQYPLLFLSDTPFPLTHPQISFKYHSSKKLSRYSPGLFRLLLYTLLQHPMPLLKLEARWMKFVHGYVP